MLQCFLEGRTKYSQEEIWRQSVEQKLKERSSRDFPTWGFIPYTVTKCRDYCGCQEVHADKSLICLSPGRFCQSLTNTEVDARSHPLDLAQGPRWRSWRRDWRSWGGLQPHGGSNSVNRPDTPGPPRDWNLILKWQWSVQKKERSNSSPRRWSTFFTVLYMEVMLSATLYITIDLLIWTSI